MTTVLNTDLIIRRRGELGLSQRALARRLAVTPPRINAIEAGRNHGEFTVRFILAIAEALAIEPAALFRAEHEPRDAAPDDIKVEAALAEQRTLTNRDDLAEAFGWDLARTDAALTALAARLSSTGQYLHRLNKGFVIRARAGILTTGETETLARGRLARRGLTIRQARLLRDVVAGEVDETWEQNASNADRVDRASLLKQGLVRLERGRLVPTEDVLFSLGLPAQRARRKRER